MSENVRLKLSPPWITYFNEIKALFEHDVQIKLNFTEDTIKLYVDNPAKAYALSQILPEEKVFGNITVKVIVIPANEDASFAEDTYTIGEIFEMAFKNNPIYAFVYEVPQIFNNRIVYVVFKNKVVQFFNDNLSDVYGNVSTLYQNIAYDVFTKDNCQGVYFCTDVEELVGKPLGEWP